MNKMQEALKFLKTKKKYGSKYVSNLMDLDSKQVVEHKRLLLFKRKVKNVEITKELADQIVNRKKVWDITKDLENYYNRFKNNKDRVARGAYREIDSEKDYNISSVKALMQAGQKAENVYLSKQDNKEFDTSVKKLANLLGKNVIYKQEDVGLDTIESFKVEKLSEEDKQVCEDVKNQAKAIFSKDKQKNSFSLFGMLFMSFVIALTPLVSNLNENTINTVYASSTNDLIVEDEKELKEESKDKVKKLDKKVYYKGSIEDDFYDDSVIIVLN